jgi:hypothetical protein
MQRQRRVRDYSMPHAEQAIKRHKAHTRQVGWSGTGASHPVSELDRS